MNPSLAYNRKKLSQGKHMVCILTELDHPTIYLVFKQNKTKTKKSTSESQAHALLERSNCSFCSHHHHHQVVCPMALFYIGTLESNSGAFSSSPSFSMHQNKLRKEKGFVQGHMDN